MAVPALPDWQKQILLGVGAPLTPSNLSYVNAWQQAEGGRATNNPFNTTQPLGNASSYNSVGVRNYPTPQAGIQATIDTLKNGRYGNIIAALRQGNDPMAAANALAASPWGTGSLVQKILGGGGAVSAAQVPSASTAMPSMPKAVPQAGLTLPGLTNALVGSLGKSPGAQLSAVMQSALAVPELPGTETSPPSLRLPSTAPPPSFAPGSFKPGSPVPTRMLSSIGAEHPTAGLDGYPAFDYMARAGTPVVAPVGGKIVRFSGHDPRAGPTEGVHGPFGWSLYLQGDDGHTYYMTHLGSRDVQVGQRVKPGTVLATIGDYAKFGGADHVHMGVH